MGPGTSVATLDEAQAWSLPRQTSNAARLPSQLTGTRSQMQTDVATAELTAADAVAFAAPPAFNRDLLLWWVLRALTVLLILAGLVMTFHILATVGFAVYGLPRSAFRRREAAAHAA